MRGLLLGGLLAVVAPAQALAADWYRVGANEADTTLAFVDKDSIRPAAGRQATATVYLISAEAMSGPIPGIVAFRNDVEVACESQQMRFVHLRAIDAGHSVLADQAFAGTLRAIGDAQPALSVLRFICAGGAAPDAVSWGADDPFQRARRELRAR